MENLGVAEKHKFLLDLIWSHSKTSEEVEEAFHDYTNALRMAEINERAALREQNARLLAAVREMERMLPVLERLEESYPTLLKEACGEFVEVPSAFNYRLALETALAKRSNP